MCTSIIPRSLILMFLTSSLLVMTACNNGVIDPRDTGTTKTTTTTVAGVVLDELDAPISGATVTVGSRTTTTNRFGMYMLTNAVVPSERACVVVRKEGYFTVSRAEWPAANGPTMVRLRLLRAMNTKSFSAVYGTTIYEGSARVMIPANGLVTSSGAAYTGTVQAAIRHFDPDTTARFQEYFSGDASAIRSDGSQVELISHGVLRVVLTDATGHPLQLKEGSAATLTYPLSRNLGATPPSTIPLWYFDESTGYWKEEGQARFEGSRYTGSVKHFTDWNLDTPAPRAYVQGTVRCASNRPASHVLVTIGQVSATTDDSGHYEHRVPANTAFNVQVQAPFNDGLSSPVATVPELAESETRTVDLLVSPCPSFLEGTLVDCADAPTSGFIMITSPKGTKYTATTTGSFRVDVPSGVPLTVAALTSDGNATVDLAVPPINEGDLVSVNALRACGAASIDVTDIELGQIGAVDAAYIDHGQSIAVLTSTSVRIYSTSTGSLQREIDVIGSTPTFTPAEGLMFSDDESVMLVFGTNGITKVFAVASGTEKTVLRSVVDAMLTPNGENVVVADSSRNLRLCSAIDGSPLKQLAKTMFRDERILIGFTSGGADVLYMNHDPSAVYIVDLATGVQKAELSFSYSSGEKGVLSMDRRLYVDVVRDRTLKDFIGFYSIPECQLITSNDFASDSSIYMPLAIAPGNQRFLSARVTTPYMNEPVMLRDVVGNTAPRPLPIPSMSTSIPWASFDEGGTHAAALFRIGGQFATLRIWKL